jgi:hypothetical protein
MRRPAGAGGHIKPRVAHSRSKLIIFLRVESPSMAWSAYQASPPASLFSCRRIDASTHSPEGIHQTYPAKRTLISIENNSAQARHHRRVDVNKPDVVDAFVRADDGADFLGADGSADGGPYACADGVLVLIRLRHPGADRAADGRSVAVTDAGVVGSAVGRRRDLNRRARAPTHTSSFIIIQS